MDDKRTFIDQRQARARGHYGHELSADEMATEFAKLDINERVEALDHLDRETASGEPLSIRDAARRHKYARALRSTHETLRKVDR
jgi:hypothetical protein